MKQLILAVPILLTFVTLSFSQTNADIQNEQDAITKLIQTCYIEGMANNGDTAIMNECFHSDFILIGLSKGQKLWSWDLEKFKEYYVKEKEEGKIPNKGGDMVSAKIISIDIEGTMALAKLELYKGETLTYIDYLNLFKFNTDWQIVCKTFYNVPEKK